jgi:hypothetical protein
MNEKAGRITIPVAADQDALTFDLPSASPTLFATVGDSRLGFA